MPAGEPRTPCPRAVRKGRKKIGRAHLRGPNGEGGEKIVRKLPKKRVLNHDQPRTENRAQQEGGRSWRDKHKRKGTKKRGLKRRITRLHVPGGERLPGSSAGGLEKNRNQCLLNLRADRKEQEPAEATKRTYLQKSKRNPPPPPKGGGGKREKKKKKTLGEKNPREERSVRRARTRCQSAQRLLSNRLLNQKKNTGSKEKAGDKTGAKSIGEPP